ncbi:MAG: hypothetical protein ACE5FT_06280 [Candidatus Nanoarchaeia archaeon]
MFETIAVLMVFFFIVAFGLGFYFVIAKAGAQKALLRQQQIEAVENAQRLTTLPELDCTQNGVQTERCVDRLKVMELDSMLDDDETRAYYFPTLGYTRLVIREVYPTGDEWEIYDRPRGEGYSWTTTLLPVKVYNPFSDKYSFGAIEVRNYE